MLIFLIIILLLLIFTLGFSYFAYRIAFLPPKRSKAYAANDSTVTNLVANPDRKSAKTSDSAAVTLHPADVLPSNISYEKLQPGIRKSIDNMLRYSFEPVTITAADGKKLFARYYHTADDTPLHILFHGYKSSTFIDCSGGTYLAKELGHNALAVDQRSHGQSEGNAITFGVLERKDCLSWVQYACERFGSETPIILSGLSMGAATVLMAADLDLPANVKGIIADCPYSSPKEIILKVSKEMHFPPRMAYPFIKLGVFLFAHFDLDEASALTSVQHARVPILLIHGENDDFVPCDMSRAIHKVCTSPITFVTVPEAGHGKSYLVSPKQYEDAVRNFVTDILKQPSINSTGDQ